MRTRDTTSLGTPEWLAIVLTLGLPLLLAGCGEGGGATPSGTDDLQDTGSSQNESDGTESSDSSDGSNTSDDTRDDDEKPVVYEWGLPSSDTSVGADHQGAEGSAYQALQRSCSEGAEFLGSDFAPEYGFESPRNVLLFAAGVRLCEGDRAAAVALFEPALALGPAGLTPDAWAFCDLYKTVRSVLEQRPPADFHCAGGAAPPYKVGDNGTTDDPLTLDVDESVVADGTDSGETEPSPETSTEPTP
jgi:hypothetical protein